MLGHEIAGHLTGDSYDVELPFGLSDWFLPAPFSAEPAAIDFTSGLRHSFLVTCDLLRAQIGSSLMPNRMCLATACSADLTVRLDESSFCQILQQRAEFRRALLRLHFVFAEQRVAELIEALGLSELPPHAGCYVVEAEAFARSRIESNEFVAELRLHQLDRTPVHRHLTLPFWLSLVSPAGFEPATY